MMRVDRHNHARQHGVRGIGDVEMLGRAAPSGDFELFSDRPAIPGRAVLAIQLDGHIAVSLFQKACAALHACLQGPSVARTPGCASKDLNNDGHIDLLDFARLQGIEWTESGRESGDIIPIKSTHKERCYNIRSLALAALMGRVASVPGSDQSTDRSSFDNRHLS